MEGKMVIVDYLHQSQKETEAKNDTQKDILVTIHAVTNFDCRLYVPRRDDCALEYEPHHFPQMFRQHAPALSHAKAAPLQSSLSLLRPLS
jgi:hypothetical protein